MKSVYILRGLPGGGKSTLAEALTFAGSFNDNDTRTVSADYYFMKQGKYVFDPRNLGAAHDACRKDFLDALKADIPLIVVDNTNIKLADFAWYEQQGVGFGYKVFVVEVHSGMNTAELARRNSHGVPESTIIKMRQNFEARVL